MKIVVCGIWHIEYSECIYIDICMHMYVYIFTLSYIHICIYNVHIYICTYIYI